MRWPDINSPNSSGRKSLAFPMSIEYTSNFQLFPYNDCGEFLSHDAYFSDTLYSSDPVIGNWHTNVLYIVRNWGYFQFFAKIALTLASFMCSRCLCVFVPWYFFYSYRCSFAQHYLLADRYHYYLQLRTHWLQYHEEYAGWVAKREKNYTQIKSSTFWFSQWIICLHASLMFGLSFETCWFIPCDRSVSQWLKFALFRWL